MGDQKATFELFDKDGDGYITKDEVGLVLRGWGYAPTNKEAEEWGNSCPDPDHISMQDLLNITAWAVRPDANTYNDLVEAFKVFDRDENGMISENDIRSIFTQLGETITPEEHGYLMRDVKIDDTGRVKYADFIKSFMNLK